MGSVLSPERVEAQTPEGSSDTCFLDMQSVIQYSRLLLLVFLGQSPPELMGVRSQNRKDYRAVR